MIFKEEGLCNLFHSLDETLAFGGLFRRKPKGDSGENCGKGRVANPVRIGYPVTSFPTIQETLVSVLNCRPNPNPKKTRSPIPNRKAVGASGVLVGLDDRLKMISSEFDVAVKTSGATCFKVNGTVGSPPLLQAASAQNESLELEYETVVPGVLEICGALSVPVANIEELPNKWTVKTPPVTSRPAPPLAPVSRSVTVSTVKGVELSEPIGLTLQPAGQVLVMPHGLALELAST